MDCDRCNSEITVGNGYAVNKEKICESCRCKLGFDEFAISVPLAWDHGEHSDRSKEMLKG